MQATVTVAQKKITVQSAPGYDFIDSDPLKFNVTCLPKMSDASSFYLKLSLTYILLF